MKLNKYLFDNDLSLIEFSRKVKYAPSYISQVMHGHRKGGRKFREEVERVTNGVVKADEIACKLPRKQKEKMINEKENLTRNSI